VREQELLRSLDGYPDAVRDAADLRAPQKISTWVREFASRFHSFYRECRVITDDAELSQARLWLVEACRIGLSSALGLLGVAAPDSMAHLDPEAATNDGADR
jgi:arginyl-tRNA synthetase